MSLYGTEIVGAHWPLDGPHRPELIESAAVALAELVRYLAHATQPQHELLTEAPRVAGLLGSLATAAHREKQLCRQLSVSARGLADDPTVRHDLGRDNDEPSRQMAATAAHKAAAELGFAVDVAEELGGFLDRARREVEWLSHDRPGWWSI